MEEDPKIFFEEDGRSKNISNYQSIRIK